ncbi:TetR/AcrR family transcriptional regulator [Acidobacteriota bacterium]
MTDKNIDSKERILDSALMEFAVHGFSGARMDRIARKAKINKAMIFYYFSSKKKLYSEILRQALLKIFIPISGIIDGAADAKMFLENVPRIYIRFFSENQELFRMVAFDLVSDVPVVPQIIKAFVSEKYDEGPGLIFKKIREWYKSGQITEADPVQFILNIVSLSFLSFIGRPIIEAVFNVNTAQESFYTKRANSVVNLLERGVLK